MRKVFLAVGMSAALVLAGCTGANKETGGTVGGAVIGALAGAAIARKGDTSGRLAGAAIGGLIGGFVGNRIGAGLDAQDRELARQRANRAMNDGETGRHYGWRNPRTGNRGVVRPTSPPYRAKRGPGRGRWCRNFAERVELADGRSETVSGRRCRTSNGEWAIVV